MNILKNLYKTVTNAWTNQILFNKNRVAHFDIVYDPRRLVVFTSRSPLGTGIWHPVVGADGVWNPGLEAEANAQVVSLEDIRLPENLAADFKAWAACPDTNTRGRRGHDQEGHQARGRDLAKNLANFVGDKYQVEYNGKRIFPGLDIEPLSREFVFGARYAKWRNKRDFTSPLYRTYLASLLWRQMAAEDRAKIFPGMFDLGNKVQIPLECCTNAELSKELTNELPIEVDADMHPFKSIEEGIKRITKRTLQSYVAQDPSKTYKVIKLLYRMQKERHNRLFHFLKMPEVKRYSLEMREQAPFVKDDISTEDAVWLLADLKTYFGFELEKKDFIDIQLTLWPVPELVNRFRNGAENVLVDAYGSDYRAISKGYATLVQAIEDFEFENPIQDRSLDEELCFYVQSLEFFHHTVGTPELFNKAIPRINVTSIRDEIIQFTRKLSTPVDTVANQVAHVPIISISEFPKFVQEFQDAFLPLMTKALGQPVLSSELSDEIIADAQGLTHNFFWFRRPAYWAEVDTESKELSFWICIGALCCAWHAKKYPLDRHAPYWRLMPEKEGLTAPPKPTSSLRTALKDSIHAQVASDRMTAEHRNIWRSRLEWFCNNLNGQGDVVVPAFQYRVSVVTKLMEIFSCTRNLDVCLQVADEFYHYVQEQAHRLHREQTAM